MICNGCVHAYYLREEEGQSQKQNCPFCRHPTPATQTESDILVMKRVKVNDPAAVCFMGNRRFAEGDYEGAIEYWTKAAELGYAEAHYQISIMYNDGSGV
jgi:TPR repeat protein